MPSKEEYGPSELIKLWENCLREKITKSLMIPKSSLSEEENKMPTPLQGPRFVKTTKMTYGTTTKMTFGTTLDASPSKILAPIVGVDFGHEVTNTEEPTPKKEEESKKDKDGKIILDECPDCQHKYFLRSQNYTDRYNCAWCSSYYSMKEYTLSPEALSNECSHCHKFGRIKETQSSYYGKLMVDKCEGCGHEYHNANKEDTKKLIEEGKICKKCNSPRIRDINRYENAVEVQCKDCYVYKKLVFYKKRTNKIICACCNKNDEEITFIVRTERRFNGTEHIILKCTTCKTLSIEKLTFVNKRKIKERSAHLCQHCGSGTKRTIFITYNNKKI